jgi:hypothetical protein
MEYRVVIKQYGNKDYREEFELHPSLRMAEKVERGVSINLNHNDYYTFIEQVKNGKIIDVIENKFL